ncbi:sensor histidine kinase [Thermovibrio sp.]
MKDSSFSEKFYLLYKVGRLAFSAGLLVLLFSLYSLSKGVFGKFSLLVLAIYSFVSLVSFFLSKRPHFFEFLLDELFLFLLVLKGAFSYTFFSIFLFFPVFFCEFFLGNYYGYFITLEAVVLQFFYFLIILRGFSLFYFLQFLFSSSALVLMMLAAKKLKLRFEAQENYIEALEKERREAELYKRLYEISADLAHELKNPLASLKGAVDLLLEGKRSERLLKIIRKETDRLDSIIKDFLNLARPLSEKKVNLSLSFLLSDIVSSLKGSEKEVELLVDGEVLISADPRALRILIENLVLNAFQWAKSKVKVSLSVSGPWAVITVEDDGPGVPENEVNRIFEPFYSKRKNGSGLGLAIVKRFLIDMGGFVVVERSPLGGAKFIVKLPLKERDEGSNT